jgi:hypothetical protein
MPRLAEVAGQSSEKGRPMSERIRWEPTKYGGWTGHVGSVDGFVFQVWKPAPLGEKPYRLESGLPGWFGRIEDGTDPDALKAEAEKWLEEKFCSEDCLSTAGEASHGAFAARERD